ncbi:MAG: type II secretion system protein [Patescibacteria group bacterium]
MSKNKRKCPVAKRGFTLIELLIVIAILGILASIILVRLQNARLKGQEASAKSTARSVLTKLAECKSDDGEASATSPTGGTTPICCTDDTCATALDGHTETWPDISTATGYDYTYLTGSVLSEDYSFQLTPTAAGSGKMTVTCAMTTNNCTAALAE